MEMLGAKEFMANPLNYIRDHLVVGRKMEEALYELALNEFKTGSIRPGLMAKAMAECDGDEMKARALYVKLLASALRDDFYLEQRREDQSDKAIRNDQARLKRESSEKKGNENSRDSEGAEAGAKTMFSAILLVLIGLMYLVMHFKVL